MKPPFKLDAHPRRPRPLLSEPPAGYFDKLPMQIMTRLPRAETRDTVAGRGWLGFLSPALRTGLASVAVLGGFAASFYIIGTPQAVPATASMASLDAVPQTELVGYLLTSGARIEHVDLDVLTAAHPGVTKDFLYASEDELNDVLDTQPSEGFTYL